MGRGSSGKEKNKWLVSDRCSLFSLIAVLEEDLYHSGEDSPLIGRSRNDRFAFWLVRNDYDNEILPESESEAACRVVRLLKRKTTHLRVTPKET